LERHSIIDSKDWRCNERALRQIAAMLGSVEDGAERIRAIELNTAVMSDPPPQRTFTLVEEARRH
jgi:hypothetical protein